MYLSLLNGFASFFKNLGNMIMSIFDIIPKLVYFMFAAFASGIDAMQALIRKLAGLDTYYSAVTGEAFFQQDPLSEFIYGILGIGNSASAYKSLNTVFWSLSIFALILLVITTMIAMIKSHYSEDASGTNPWKYIYTAIKSVLTFAIIPVVMVMGLKLTSFVLVTLDNITAGTADEEKVKQVYGTDATEMFTASTLKGSDKKSYIHYDFFSFGDATSSTPMGAMLFKAAAFSCNRARAGTVSYADYGNIKINGKQVFASQSCQEFTSLTSTEEKQEYVAYQIDFGFMNNLQWKQTIAPKHLNSTIDSDGIRYYEFSDVFGGFGNIPIRSFSKFHVSAVWFFYDLWMFNFIVAFGGGVTIFGILISVILGLMTRLVKGAALFLIYPPLLGIAPLDNFKAFKSWGQTMMQQVMMAYGAILGMNIVLLLLPYLQNIAFFNIGIIDALISMVLLIAALLMMKDFISMVSGFVGGADANASGAGLKSEMGAALKKGASITGKIGGSAAKAIGAAGVGAVKGIVKGVQRKKREGRVAMMNTFSSQSIDSELQANAPKGGITAKTNEAMEAAKKATTAEDVEKLSPEAKAAYEAMQQAKTEGLSDEQTDAAARNAIQDTFKNMKSATGQGSVYDSLKKKEDDQLEQMKKDPNLKGQAEVFERYRQAREDKDATLTGRSTEFEVNKQTGKIEQTDTIAKNIGKGFEKFGEGAKAFGENVMKSLDGVSFGKTIAEGFAKSVGSLGEAMGLDKAFADCKEIFKTSLTSAGGPFEDKKKEGDALQSDIAKGQSEQNQQQTALLKNIASELKDLKRAQASTAKFTEKTYHATKNSSSKGSGDSSDSSK